MRRETKKRPLYGAVIPDHFKELQDSGSPITMMRSGYFDHTTPVCITYFSLFSISIHFVGSIGLGVKTGERRKNENIWGGMKFEIRLELARIHVAYTHEEKREKTVAKHLVAARTVNDLVCSLPQMFLGSNGLSELSASIRRAQEGKEIQRLIDLTFCCILDNHSRGEWLESLSALCVCVVRKEKVCIGISFETERRETLEVCTEIRFPEDH